MIGEFALADRRPGALAAAIDAAKTHPDGGLLRDARASLARLPADAKGYLDGLKDSGGRRSVTA